MTGTDDRWASGRDDDAYIGRWSRLVAPVFLDWLAVPARARWLDVGCGTGAAPTYVATLTPSARDALRDRLRGSVQPDGDGAIRLTARAWAVRGRRPA